MEKSTSTAEPPSSATSSLPPQSLPLPTAADKSSSSAELPPVAMDLEIPPASSIPGASVQGQASPTPHLGAQVPVPPSDPPSCRGRKRALEGNLQIENSNYYKIRLLVKDLRPHFLEILRTPDFRNSKAAIEIQEKMKLMLELYQEMIGQTPKRERTTKSESLSNGKAINQTPHTTTTEPRPSEAPSNVPTDYPNSLGDGDKVVGGSAFGWNFITYGGTHAVYSGLSKEEYRTSHPIIQPPEVDVELQTTL